MENHQLPSAGGQQNTLGFFGHGKNMRHWQFWLVLECPQCGELIEDKPHITQCQNKAATLEWDKAIKKLQQWF